MSEMEEFRIVIKVMGNCPCDAIERLEDTNETGIVDSFEVKTLQHLVNDKWVKVPMCTDEEKRTPFERDVFPPLSYSQEEQILETGLDDHREGRE